MDTGRIAHRYAKAVYEYAQARAEEDRLYREMKMMSDHFFQQKALSLAMENPTVSAADKEKLLFTAAGIQVSESMKAIVGLVLKKHRETYMRSISLMYQEYYRKNKGMVTAKLVSSEPATPEMEARLRALITKETMKSVDFQLSVDPSLIGGFVLSVDSRQLDASIKSQLYKLKRQLAGK